MRLITLCEKAPTKRRGGQAGYERAYIRSSDTWLPFRTEPSYCGYGRTRQASAKTEQGDRQGICGQCRENQGR